jgi:hypothetical protein
MASSPQPKQLTDAVYDTIAAVLVAEAERLEVAEPDLEEEVAS